MISSVCNRVFDFTGDGKLDVYKRQGRGIAGVVMLREVPDKKQQAGTRVLACYAV